MRASLLKVTELVNR